ncbi:hypothetical protein K438DRAFT_1785684 [Mycena galopus ATCC 62051]|nr:hypothetical protein K438DRAFT_1785684 [Mycena galopus ATCC 62051]
MLSYSSIPHGHAFGEYRYQYVSPSCRGSRWSPHILNLPLSLTGPQPTAFTPLRTKSAIPGGSADLLCLVLPPSVTYGCPFIDLAAPARSTILLRFESHSAHGRPRDPAHILGGRLAAIHAGSQARHVLDPECTRRPARRRPSHAAQAVLRVEESALCPGACVFCLPLRELFNLGESFDYADQLRATSDTATDDHFIIRSVHALSHSQSAQCTSLLILAPLHFAFHLTPELSPPLRHVGMAIHTRTRLPSPDTLPALLLPGSLARLWRFTRSVGLRATQRTAPAQAPRRHAGASPTSTSATSTTANFSTTQLHGGESAHFEVAQRKPPTSVQIQLADRTGASC